MENIELVEPNPINRDTYRGYDTFDEISSFELDWYIVYYTQCEDSDGIESNEKLWEEEWRSEEEINEACWDDESIILSTGWDKPTPQYVIDKAEEYFDRLSF